MIVVNTFAKYACGPLLAAGALLVLNGCETTAAARSQRKPALPRNELPVVAAATLFDGFEGPEHSVWAFDAADDEAIGQYVAEGATQGKKALKITLRDKGVKGKIHLRRDVELDLSKASALIFDITAPSDKIAAALALKSDPGDVFQEAKYLPLKTGLNRDVRFALDSIDWKNAQTNWEYAGPPVNLDKVKRLILLFYTNGESSGSLLVDNLRVESAGSVYREWRPEIVQYTPPPQGLPRYQGVQLLIAFRASYRDVFDASDIAVGAWVTAPSRKTYDVRGFLAGLGGPLQRRSDALLLPPFWGPFKPSGESGKDDGDKAALKIEDELPIWAVRFTPQEIGRYGLQLYVRNKLGETRTAPVAMVVVPEQHDPALPGRKGGNVRVSARDARQLELQDGSPFFIFGQNVAWTQNWTPYLEKIKAYGGNTCRIWLCPWGLNLERQSDPGAYDLQAARRLDDLLTQAEATGVRIILCFTFHGATSDFWPQSPYNAANGGPCARPEEFFTDRNARRQFKRLLAYAAARWGASPALLAWELINEMDLAKFDRAEDLAVWTQEMAGYLKTVDVHGHLVTTSAARTDFLPDLWQDSRVDFVSIHAYGTDVSKLLSQHLTPYRALNKPWLLAEFGGGWNPADDVPDKDGARLQAALWLSACAPACGATLPWWWDTYLEAHNLYPVFAATARFLAGDDRRGRFGEWVRKSCEGGVEVWGIMDSQGARLYVHQPEWTRQPETRAGALLKAPLPLALNAMLDGNYRVEFWDAKEGKVFATQDAVARSGKLEIQLPPHAGEFAVKLERTEFSKSGLK